MEIRSTSSCAIMDINYLAQHPTPLDAMKEFCRQNIVTLPKFFVAGGINNGLGNAPRNGSLYSFYLFSAACNAEGGPVYSSGKAYGREFAQFIEDNNLGNVWASPIKHNTVFHPDHCNQIWIWEPDHKALKAWWAEQQKAEKPKTPKKPVKVNMDRYCEDCGDILPSDWPEEEEYCSYCRSDREDLDEDEGEEDY